MSLERRFWPKVDRRGPNECWLWTAAKDTHRYGILRREGGGIIPAHRVAYELLVGPIPPGLQLDHLCRVRHCVNPAHLEPVTNRENILRGDTIMAANARKTHCPQGHAYDEANTRTYKTSRYCRRCGAERERARVRTKRGGKKYGG